jgi:hypothetical protein
MTEFKFLRGYVGTLNVMDGETYATASFNDDTAEGHVYRRQLYHTNRDLYNRLRNPFNNNEMERYYYDRQLGRYETVRPTLNQEEVIRRINEGRDLNDNPIRLFQTTSVTTVNPKWWMKIKMFFQEANFNGEIVGIIFIAGSLTIAAILTISKLLNAW